mgnify:CR=1 FL=1
MRPEVSIIIPARNEAENLSASLKAINSQRTNRKIEIIVIDSESDDNTVEVAMAHGARVIKIKRKEFDHGKTRNLGLTQAQGKYLVTLVADALPADEFWLEELIAPLEKDEKVAGAYSRQIAPVDAHPLEAQRILRRFTGKEDAIVNELPIGKRWEDLSPTEKMFLADFDDVSSIRRREIWEKIPITENYWGEDLDWSVKVLKAGYRIAYAPKSCVYHAHKPALIHSFRRAYVDQTVVFHLFGLIYYSNAREFCAGVKELIRQDHVILKRSALEMLEKHKWLIINPFIRLLEGLGAYLAGDMVQHIWHPEKKIYRDLFWTFYFTHRKGNVLRTTFTINGEKKNVIFAHPPSSISFTMRVPPQGKLEFYPAINPEVWGKSGEVQFEVTVNGIVVYNTIMNPSKNSAHRKWIPAAIELEKWMGRKIKVEMRTRARDLKNAWAGWGVPCVTAQRESFPIMFRRYFLKAVSMLIYYGPLRHP